MKFFLISYAISAFLNEKPWYAFHGMHQLNSYFHVFLTIIEKNIYYILVNGAIQQVWLLLGAQC